MWVYQLFLDGMILTYYRLALYLYLHISSSDILGQTCWTQFLYLDNGIYLTPFGSFHLSFQTVCFFIANTGFYTSHMRCVGWAARVRIRDREKELAASVERVAYTCRLLPALDRVGRRGWVLPDTNLVWKSNFQIFFPDAYLVKSQAKYIWKIWLLGQERIWKVKFFLNRLSSYVLGRISGKVHKENLIFRASTYLESRIFKSTFQIRTWSSLRPSTYLKSRIFFKSTFQLRTWSNFRQSTYGKFNF